MSDTLQLITGSKTRNDLEKAVFRAGSYYTELTDYITDFRAYSDVDVDELNASTQRTLVPG